MKTFKINFQLVAACPLCGGAGIERAKLARSYYYFGMFRIPLPENGVGLIECHHCGLLFKSAVPDSADLSKVMAGGASEVWKRKTGIHPALSWILPYVNESARVLDVGASNGDLLAQLKPYVRCISALDVVRYPHCAEVLNGEYIIGDLERGVSWSGEPYQVMTAFDVFEHFVCVDAALSGLQEMVAAGGKLIVETGDWACFKQDLGNWYYANLFEHHVFWTRKTFEYVCGKYGFSMQEYRRVPHKNRRAMGWAKFFATELIVFFSGFPVFQRMMLGMGKGDPLRFARPGLEDHAFVVLEKQNA